MIATSGPLAASVAHFALFLMSVALVLALIRLVLGPSLPDRVVALDLMMMIAVGLMATYSIVTRETAILDVAIVASLVAFLGTVAFANYLERKSSK
jgi:multicomponent Na+:H+ antiporter subunit F